ncbi:MAG TPA: hypothetical protein VGX68_25535 [Thermoanaerobaculia bacterium]|jgi:hypothetical protein|nr:hypothetical protein [Thermoanaerobaculia bacterium]
MLRKSWLFLGFLILCLAGPASAQIRTVLVSPVPGDPVGSGTALRNALTGISSPSSTNRWLLKIEPGIYDVGSTSLQMRSWVDIEGSGIGVTTIHGSVDSSLDGTVNGANNAELRLLTVEAQSNFSIAMANIAASPRLYRLKLIATAVNAWGIRNTDGSAPLIEECEIVVTSTSTSSSFATGILFKGFPPAGVRSSILRSTIRVSGAATNYGVNMLNAQTVTLIRDSQMDVTGGTTTYGIAAAPNGPWLGQENLKIRDSEISSAGGSSASYGIKLEAGTFVALDINNSKVWGHVAPTTNGIVQLGDAIIVLQGSSLVGFPNTVQTASNISIASTLLNGGPATASGWIGCMGVWDENAAFYANSCP